MVCSVVPEVFTDFSRHSAELTLVRLFQVLISIYIYLLHIQWIAWLISFMTCYSLRLFSIMLKHMFEFFSNFQCNLCQKLWQFRCMFTVSKYEVYQPLNIAILFDSCTHFSFIRKRFIRKWGSNGQNHKKILRKSRDSISRFECFYWPKIDISSLLHSKC